VPAHFSLALYHALPTRVYLRNISIVTARIFKMLKSLFAVTAAAIGVVAHGNHDQTPMPGPHKSMWYNTLPGDGGTQVIL
jgi:hypothetical protein